MTPLVLVHGGGFDSRCWDRLLPFVEGPVLAVDLPGRGRHPADLESVTFASCADSVVADVDAAGLDDIVLVGHSLAGCSMPSIVERLGPRVRHAVYLACSVPERGLSTFDTLDPEVLEAAGEPAGDGGGQEMGGDIAAFVLGTDLTPEQVAWCTERFVAESTHLVTDPVDPTPLRSVPGTWIRTLRDLIVPPDKQLRFARNVGDCPVIDLDAGHMSMVGRPDATAALLNEIAASV